MNRIVGAPARTAATNLLLAGLIVFAAGCRSYDQDPWPGTPPEDQWVASAPYVIAEGDRVRIAFQYQPELNVEAVVRPDGRVTAPYVGEIQAGGTTVAVFKAALQEALTPHLKDPVLNIDILEVATREVYVGGEVRDPGIVEFKGTRIDILEAIVKAGGPLKESADLENVILAREENGVRYAWKVNLDPILTAKLPPQPVPLRHRDVILVPNSPVDQANIFVDKYITRMIPGGPGLAALFLLQRN